MPEPHYLGELTAALIDFSPLPTRAALILAMHKSGDLPAGAQAYTVLELLNPAKRVGYEGILRRFERCFEAQNIGKTMAHYLLPPASHPQIQEALSGLHQIHPPRDSHRQSPTPASPPISPPVEKKWVRFLKRLLGI